jgi:hypothetical protein
MKLYKRPDSPNWFVSYTLNGERKRVFLRP